MPVADPLRRNIDAAGRRLVCIIMYLLLAPALVRILPVVIKLMSVLK
jgi:hypothetical protein